MLEFKLPYPPSINGYYKNYRGKTVLGESGRGYRALIRLTLWQCITTGKKFARKPLDGDLGVEIFVYPPDKRIRDIDNIQKCLFDSLQHAGLYHNDYQISSQNIIRAKKTVKGGVVILRIFPANHDEKMLEGLIL